MGDDGTMAKGTRYTPEFRAKAVRLLAESRSSYSSETKAIEQVAKDLGIAPESLRRWRNQSDATAAAETKRSAQAAMAELKRLRAENTELRRANEISTTASAFSRPGSTRHGVDGRVHRRAQKPFQGRADLQGPVRSAGLWPPHTPRGYRMSRPGPVSRMRARHEAPARDVMDIHAGGSSAVYGYREVRHGLIGKGRDPGEAGRDQVMDIMRGLGMQGVRRGKTPRHHQAREGHGRQARPVDRRFEAEAPNRPHVAGITYVLMADGRFAYTASVTGVFARRIVGRACATTMNTEEPPPAGVGAGDRVGRVAWRDRRPRPPRRSWRAVHRHGVHHQGYGIWDAAVDRHGRRPVRQRHGRKRRRRVQDRAGMAAQAIPGYR